MRNFTFKFRRDIAADWVSKNPVLASGEPGVELDTGKFKIGNGIAAWTVLPYFLNEVGLDSYIQVAIENAILEGIPGAQGPKGDPGDPGADGESAYEVALDNGFIGTVTEWLTSLVGPQGIQGVKGDTGTAGATGATGATGPKGDKGDKGDPGNPGADGADGFGIIKVWNETTSVYDIATGATIYVGGPTDPTTLSGEIWIPVPA